MKLSQLAAKPQLIEIILDDENTVAKYGEAVSFWIYDRQDIETFAKMATMKPGDFTDAAGFVKDLILDQDGTPVTKDGFVLPTDIMMKTVTKVIEELGKSVEEVSKPTTQS